MLPVLTAWVVFGQDKAKLAYDSHQWALEHVGEVSKGLNISCEYRTLPAYTMVNFPETENCYEAVPPTDCSLTTRDSTIYDTTGEECLYFRAMARCFGFLTGFQLAPPLRIVCATAPT